jgi:hypothetical protein
LNNNKSGNADQIKELLKTDSSRAVADMAVIAVGNDPDAFSVAMETCLNAAYPVNMRAARVVSLSVAMHPELMLPYLNVITRHIITQTTDGVKRGLMKAVIDAADIDNIPDSGLLIDHCFGLILDSAKPYAWRVYAMDIVYRASLNIPELAEELQQTLMLIDNDSPCSVRARAGIILKKLGRKKN